MKRGGPLRRKTPLQSRTPLRRTGRLNPVGRKARRERDDLDDARTVVRTRARGACECPGCPSCKYGFRAVCTRAVDHVHHIWPEDRDRGVHDPDRMLGLCAACHTWTHENPVSAARIGTLRPSTDDR